MYGWVGECLLVILEEVLGEEWTPRVAAAWTEAYGAISGAREEIDSWSKSAE